MRSKLSFLDPIIAIGIIISVAIAIILVLIGQDQATDLLIGLVLTTITLLIDMIARIKESEERILQASTLETTLTLHPMLFSTASQISRDYASVKKLGYDFFTEKADDTLTECRDTMHGLAEGRMIEDVDRAKLSFGTRGIRDAKTAIKTTAYADVSFWRTKYGAFILEQNAGAVQRGVDFTRIWIQPHDTLVEYADILKMQHDAGIKTLIALPEDLPHSLLGDYRIIDDKVLITLELLADGQAKTQHVSIDPIEVERAVNNFDLLLKHTRSFSDLPKDTKSAGHEAGYPVA